jgi:hypothetical protein
MARTREDMRYELDDVAETARLEWDEATKQAAAREAEIAALKAELEAVG